MPEPRASIIIPFYGRYDLVMARLYELNIYVQESCEVMLVNDASPEDDFEGNIAWWQNLKKHTIRYIKNPENLGFGGSMNRGARKSTGEFLFFLSNDVQVSGDFVAPVVQKLQENPKQLVGGKMIDWNAGWNEVYEFGNPKRKKLTIPWLEGWFLACTRVGWEELGGFDPIYKPFDMEDLDISTKAVSIGYALCPTNFPFLKHLSGTTIMALGIDRMSITQANRAKYIEKWGDKLAQIYHIDAKEMAYAS